MASQLKLTEEFNMARSVGGSGKAPAGTPGAGDMEEITQEQTSLTLGVRSRERCVFFLPPSLPLCNYGLGLPFFLPLSAALFSNRVRQCVRRLVS